MAGWVVKAQKLSAMFLRRAALVAALAPCALAWSTEADALKPLTIATEGINATFIGYGARLTHLNVHDKNGQARDIVVGYDDPVDYTTEASRNFFGAIVGYARRFAALGRRRLSRLAPLAAATPTASRTGRSSSDPRRTTFPRMSTMG